jgi:Flp pilus assembly protein TadG
MIKRLWNDRRGASALFVTAAMVPLLGLVSLGTEVGSWYVIRRHAQNAADAAAIAGATALAVNDPTGAVTAGQAFANSNGFATGMGVCPPTMPTTVQNVCIKPLGAAAAGTTVTAVVTQYERPIFAGRFVPKDNSGNKSVMIQATAVATIQQKPGYCMLGLTSLDISGSTDFGGGCGMASNGTFAPPPAGQNPFSGNPNNWSVTAAGACTGNANKCNLSGEVKSYSYNTGTSVALPSALDHLMNGGVVPTQPTPPKGGITYSTNQPSPSTTTPPTWQPNGLSVPAGTTMTLPSGLYLFPGLQVDGTLKGTGVNIIIGSGGFSQSKNNTGTGVVNMTAGTGGALSDMNGVLIFDQEGQGASTPPQVKFAGQFTSNFNGAIYFPYSHLTYRGGSNLTGCMVVVAKVLDFGGNSSMDMSGCSDSVLQNDVVPTNVVILTQ